MAGGKRVAMYRSPGLYRALCTLQLPQSYHPQPIDECLPHSLDITRYISAFLQTFLACDIFNVPDTPTQPHFLSSADVFMNLYSHSQPLWAV